MGIGKKLEELMKAEGTNANELAGKIGISPQTIYSMIKRDSKKADIDVLIRIARELNVEPEYFCESEEELITPEQPYTDVEKLIARNGNKLTVEEKMKLIKMLSEL